MKNTLGDLNNHLFAQLEKLGDEDLKGDELEAEIRRSEAMAKVGEQIIKTAITGSLNRKPKGEQRAMTETRKKEICKEYARCQQNCLSSSAERRMEELEAEAAKAGLRFEMTNRAQYMMPHFLGEPRYELVTA